MVTFIDGSIKRFDKIVKTLIIKKLPENENIKVRDIKSAFDEISFLYYTEENLCLRAGRLNKYILAKNNVYIDKASEFKTWMLQLKEKFPALNY